MKTRDNNLISLIHIIRAMHQHGVEVKPKDVKAIINKLNLSIENTLYSQVSINIACDLSKPVEEAAQDMIAYARKKRAEYSHKSEEVTTEQPSVVYPIEDEQLTIKFDIMDYTLRDLLNAGIKVEVHAYKPETNKQQ